MYCNTILYSDVEEGVRLYCNMRKCIAIGGLEEELYCRNEIVLQIGWNCIARQQGATGNVLKYNFCIVTNSNGLQ